MKKIFVFILIFYVFIFQSTLSFASSKEIFLTFDDGPSKKVCKEILDILDSEEVKGTFFILGDSIKGNEDIIKRMFVSNHSLGLHSMSHSRKIYSSDEAFISEMKNVQTEIFNLTGFKSNILRFPFGVNNATYKLKPSLVSKLHDNNFKIFDWTLDSKDGEFFSNPSSFFLKNSISKNDNIVLLMHCADINKTSPNALKMIINHYKKEGYTFKTINEDTPEIYKIFTKKNQ